MSDDRSPDEKQRGILAEALTAGITFPLCVFVGYLAGSWADRHWGVSPFGLTFGILLGLAAALVPVFRLNRAFERVEQEKKRRAGGGGA